MDRHISVICDTPELKAFDLVLREESRVLGFTYTLSRGVESEKFAEEIERSDAILISTEDLSESVISAIRNSQAKLIVSFTPSFKSLERGNVSFIEKAGEYFERGGVQNIDSLIKLSLWSCGEELSFPDVVKIPWHGIYHPRAGVFTDISKFLWEYPFSIFPMAGIVFSRRSWLYGEVRNAMNAISEIESRRYGVMPVFTHSVGSELKPLLENVKVVLSYVGVSDELMELGVPIVDCIKERFYHPNFPGFSGVTRNPIETTIRWLEFETKDVKKVGVEVSNPEIRRSCEERGYRLAEEGESCDLVLTDGTDGAHSNRADGVLVMWRESNSQASQHYRKP